MKEYQLIYFSECPNYQPAVELLKKAGFDFELICQDELDFGNPLVDYSSPTLLKSGKVIFGSKAGGGGCSVGLPSLDELKKISV